MKLLTIDDLSKILQVKVSTIRTWIYRGEIPKSVQFKIGGTIRFKEDKVIEWINNNECV